MENRKVRANPFQALIEAYEQELLIVDPATCPNIHSQIKSEIRKLREGVIDTIDILSEKKIKLRAKIDFPVEQYPMVNFPGKVIGPKGKTLKDLQEQTETRMSVLGAGSMRNQSKEIELIATGDPKYQHLNERMHLQIDCLGAPSETYEKISKALVEIKKIITPSSEEMVVQTTPYTWSDISYQQQSMGGGRGMIGYNSNPYSLGGFGKRGQRVEQMDPTRPPQMPFNGYPSFGTGYEQADVITKIPPSQRFGPVDQYRTVSGYP